MDDSDVGTYNYKLCAYAYQDLYECSNVTIYVKDSCGDVSLDYSVNFTWQIDVHYTGVMFADTSRLFEYNDDSCLDSIVTTIDSPDPTKFAPTTKRGFNIFMDFISAVDAGTHVIPVLETLTSPDPAPIYYSRTTIVTTSYFKIIFSNCIAANITTPTPISDKTFKTRVTNITFNELIL